jgi:hypothetical protein
MSEAYQKTEITGVYRDADSGAFVNTDIEALKGYKKRKQSNRIVKRLDERLVQVENELNNIHYMIEKILNNIEDNDK